MIPLICWQTFDKELKDKEHQKLLAEMHLNLFQLRKNEIIKTLGGSNG